MKTDPSKLSDDELLALLEQLAREEKGRLSFFLACLAEADRRNAVQKRGFTSTFDYCVKQLHLSEDEAYRRIHACRAAEVRPQIYSSIKDGLLSLSVVSKLAPHMRRPDASELIDRAQGKTFREVEKLVAPLTPDAPRRDTARAVAVFVKRKLAATEPGTNSPGQAAAPLSEVPAAPAKDQSNAAVTPELVSPPPAPDLFQMAAPVPSGSHAVEIRIDFHFQGSVALRDSIDRAKELLAHKFPIGRLGEILQEVVMDYLDRHDPQRALKLGRLGPVPGRATIPAAVRRAVWARDGGRCSYVGTTGQRCIARRALELDHRRPRALGGRDTVDNLRLLCRPHNDAERRRLLGEGRITPARPARGRK